MPGGYLFPPAEIFRGNYHYYLITRERRYLPDICNIVFKLRNLPPWSRAASRIIFCKNMPIFDKDFH
ncbi:MAG: hypothetical protein CVT49_12395 [candidate division Zixibacteria bacterium HGW-Zixibacteria-1]|nr:MAG: hypothetical protein CVT49_12395 [candidate division Zixibacteria bacterium HGW-Zixibacteria-1]